MVISLGLKLRFRHLFSDKSGALIVTEFRCQYRQTRGDNTARFSEAVTAESTGETGSQGESVSMETAYTKSR